jgi:hypothetical protein
MSIWDDPALQAPPEADYVRLDKVGDGFDGRVIAVTKQTFDDGSAAPQVTFLDDSDGETRNWTAGQIDSKRKLAELRPEAGDHISVRFTGTSGKFKHITITVNARNYQQPTAPAESFARNTTVPATPPRGAAEATVVQLPTYQPAPPPVYATNGNGYVTDPGPTNTADAPPAGVDPSVWARMDDGQRRQLLQVFMGDVPAF